MGQNACSEPISGLGGHTFRTGQVRKRRTRLPSSRQGVPGSHPLPLHDDAPVTTHMCDAGAQLDAVRLPVEVTAEATASVLALLSRLER